MSETRALFDDFIDRYQSDFIGFARDILHLEFDRNQMPLALAIQSGNRLIAAKSGHGPGKTTVLAAASVWFANTRYPMKVIMVAPSAKQLWDALWPTTRSLFNRLPDALKSCWNILAERIEHKADPDESFISPATATKENPEAIAGKHSANILILVDEASGIPDEVFDAGAGSMSGHNAQTVLASNPTRLTGFFFRVFNDPDLTIDWDLHTLNAERSAFVAPEFIRMFERMHGRDSNAFRVRVLGEFPLSDDDAYISPVLVQAAMDRDGLIAIPPVRPIWGCDPAGKGKDRTAFCERLGPVTMPLISWGGQDTMKTVGFMVNRYRECQPGAEPSQILVDVIGIGAGVVDRLGELGLPVVAVNVAEVPAMESSMCDRLRDELWWKGHQELLAHRCSLPPDPELKRQLSQPTYDHKSDGTLQIESKKSMRKRGLGSPDKADAWLMTFAGDAATMIGSTSGKWGTYKPRKIAVA
jgi:phage terminase large subunit